MIVHRPELQAYECDGCGKMYEIQRASGREDAMNKALDFKRRIEHLHAECTPPEDAAPETLTFQQGAQAIVA